MQWWTIDAGDDQDVVGEASYLDALLRVCGGRTPDGPRIKLVTAQLLREPSNRHDKDAVAVYIGEDKVGYLPREEACEYHRLIDHLRSAGEPATCRARLTGGWDRGAGDRGHVGVVLDIGSELRPRRSHAAFLPRGRSVTVVDEEKHQDVLATMLRNNRPVEKLAVLGGLDDRNRLGVYIDGHLVGKLTTKMTDRYLPIATYVHQSGFPPSCEANVMKGAKKIEVELSIFHPDIDV